MEEDRGRAVDVALNVFLTRMDLAVSTSARFCTGRETVFHVFSECERLTVHI